MRLKEFDIQLHGDYSFVVKCTRYDSVIDLLFPETPKPHCKVLTDYNECGNTSCLASILSALNTHINRTFLQ